MVELTAMLATFYWEHAKNNFPAVSPAKYDVKAKAVTTLFGSVV